jgi:hypothetical protein
VVPFGHQKVCCKLTFKLSTTNREHQARLLRPLLKRWNSLRESSPSMIVSGLRMPNFGEPLFKPEKNH